MKIQVLETTIYEPDGRTYRTDKTARPTWPNLEEAVLSLDQFHRPIVGLFLSATVSDRLSDNVGMTVVGGRGVYTVECMPGDGKFHSYCDPSKGAEEVDVWLSDQGSQAEERHVCRDVDVVLEIVRHFAETAKMSDSVMWT